MVVRLVTVADIPLLLEDLARLPNPPNETEDSMAAILAASRFFYIDTVERTFARVAPRLNPPKDEEMDTVVVYWLTPGKLVPIKHTPVLGVACRAVKRAHPELGPKRIWGDFPGSGDTDAKRLSDSRRQAREHESWMGADLKTGDSENNDKMGAGWATLDQVITAIDTLEAAT